VGAIGSSSIAALPEGPTYELCGDGPEDFQGMPLQELIDAIFEGTLPVHNGKVFCIDNIMEASRTQEENLARMEIVVPTYLSIHCFSVTTGRKEVDYLSTKILNQTRETLPLILRIERFSKASCLHSWVLAVRVCPFIPVQ